ncbi:MAG: HAD-IC family P-type ATPase, partial [Clostridium sp.]|nr:HAD-IC family P-type ATPase [Clostridium sp.]
MSKKQKKMLYRIITAAVLMVILHFVPAEGTARFLLYMIPYLTVGYDILWKAVKGIRNGQVFDENFLMAAATVGALILGLTRTGDYVEAVAVMLFYQIGELFQSVAVGKSRRNISELMDIRPDYANVEEDGELVQQDPEDVEIGTEILVKPGERIPIDGIVTEGSSTLDTAALTGESIPRDVGPGNEVISGCINMTGLLRIRTTKEFGESTVAKILDMVENASSLKSRSENFISRFARVYTPAVCISALALALIPPAARMCFMGLPPEWADWFYRALTFLVISCPCALVVSIPLSFFASIGGAGRAGVLVKGSSYLEALSQVTCMVFDKTGTLTKGIFEVQEICPAADGGLSEEQLLEYAALAESASNHPISESIRRACRIQPDLNRVKEIQELGGHGVTALADGKKVAAGNRKLMEKLGIACEDPKAPGTIVYMAVDGRYAGCIRIADSIKDT